MKKDIIEITRDEVTMLWHSDWYDGVLSGFLVYHGVYCYFSLADQKDRNVNENWYRKYDVYPLTLDEFIWEREKQDFYRKCYGNDNEFNSTNNIYHTDEEKHKEFNDKYPDDTGIASGDGKYANRPLIAIFVD